MKTVLITGATGFIGRHLVEQALEAGFQVIASVRKSSNTQWLEEQKIPIVILSLEDPEKLVFELKNIAKMHGTIDDVFHNAGITQSLKSATYYEVNYILTKNLVKALTISFSTPPRFIYTSSLAAIGPGDPSTLKPIGEYDKPNPVAHYGKSKLRTEQFLMTHENLSWIIVRPTAVYGPHEKNIFKMIQAVNRGVELYLGSKKQMLSFIHAQDLAHIFIKLSMENISKKVYNVSDGNAYQATEVNRILKSELGRKTLPVLLPVGLLYLMAAFIEIASTFTNNTPIFNLDKVNEIKQRNWLCNSSMIKNDIGFSPIFDLKKGMHETISWYKKNGWL